MLSVDVNVLVYAFDTDSPHHVRARKVLEETAITREPLVLFPPVLAGFTRVTTDRRILINPAAPAEALAYLQALLDWPNTRVTHTGSRWWDIFVALAEEYAPRGAEVSDAALAATAIETGATWVSFDRGFARFRGLTWVNPADSPTQSE